MPCGLPRLHSTYVPILPRGRDRFAFHVGLCGVLGSFPAVGVAQVLGVSESSEREKL